MQFVLIIVQDNGGAGVVVTTSQTISSDSMVSNTWLDIKSKYLK